MRYTLSFPAFGRFFNVPCAAVDNFIRTTDGNFYKVLLCALCSDSPELDTEELAARAGVSPSEAEDALLFWISRGVLRAAAGENQPAAGLPETMPVEMPAAVPVSAPMPEETPAPAGNDQPAKAVPAKMTVRYSPKELAERAKESREVAELYEQVQKIFGRPINNTETAGLLGLYEYFGMSVPSIMILAQFAHDNGKDRIAYIEAVARDWFGRGITEYPDIEREISRMTEQSRTDGRLKRLLGVEGALTKKQQEFFAQWTEWGFSDDMIALADEKCRDSKNKTDLRYINGILRRWHDDGLTTPAAVSEKEQSFEKTRAGAEPKNSSFSLDEWYQQAESFDPELIGSGFKEGDQ